MQKNFTEEIKMFYVLFCWNCAFGKVLSLYCYSLFAAAFHRPQFQTFVYNVGFINIFIDQFSLKIRAKAYALKVVVDWQLKHS